MLAIFLNIFKTIKLAFSDGCSVLGGEYGLVYQDVNFVAHYLQISVRTIQILKV